MASFGGKEGHSGHWHRRAWIEGLAIVYAAASTNAHIAVQQVQQAAAKAGSEPLPFCDKGAEVFKVGETLSST